MNAYERWILPALLDFAMRQKPLRRFRRDVVGAASGRVLEIGIGSGLNLPFYSPAATSIVGLDPSERLLAMARRRAADIATPVQLVPGSATAIPLDAGSVDTVIVTWALCTIPDPHAALLEMRRVLAPGGALRLVEHGLSPEPRVARWQHSLTPLWRHIAGGCHLDRPIAELVREAGFSFTELVADYAEGPRPMTYMYRGRAVPEAT